MPQLLTRRGAAGGEQQQLQRLAESAAQQQPAVAGAARGIRLADRAAVLLDLAKRGAEQTGRSI